MISKSLIALMLIAGSFSAGLPNCTYAQTATQETAKQLPFVSTIFGDNMVMQRGKLNTIWGWSKSGDRVRVEIAGKHAEGVAAADGKWKVQIKPPKMGGPYTMTITGAQSVQLHNVLVGDVWLCGGQSNMQLPLRFSEDGEQVVKEANHPQIRFFSVAAHPAYHATDTVQGKWQEVTPETASWLSAVGYYFALKVQSEIHVPIGLVVDALGGTPAEAWASAAALKPLHDFDVPLAMLKKLADEGAPEYGNYVMHWYDQYDVGLKGHWQKTDLDDADWQTVDVPGGFKELGVPETPAVVWFRREIDLPDPLPAGVATLFLGEVERMDTAYINGTEVGGSAWVENPRVYPLHDGVLKPGKNEIVIRVFKTKPDGGFMGSPDVLHLMLGDKSVIPLAGKWKAKLSVDARPPHAMPIGFENWPVMPTVLYKGMLEPIAPLALSGAIWYQGEQNSPRGYQYRRIMPAMIADWRQLFAQGEFPFYIVSLPKFMKHSTTPVDDDWADTRESQAIAAESVPNSCLAVTIDTGEADSIHPKEKKPVGDRLGLCALAGYYHKHVVDSGPTLKRVERLPDEIRLHFAHADGGLAVRGPKLGEFSIAGNDQVWHWADARIEGDTVIVSSPDVPHPKEVRYAWQSNPEATLFNGAGLPAGPFRTDDWPLETQNHRPY
ncbi:MAG TPA: sialate O-acetylesterase [Terracidiphilus sp.]|nr:sialate O-acetylesterase [Terracidiphilus sp.]